MAGTITVTHQKHRTIRKLSLAWVTDKDGDMSGDSPSALPTISGIINRIVIIPDSGDTIPTDGYDLVINDEDGIDILQGIGGDLSNSASLEINPGNELCVEESDTELYCTNLYSGSDADVNDTRKYGSDIALDRINQQIAIDIKYDGSGSTDDLKVSVFKQRGGAWDGDEIAVHSVTIPSDGSEDIQNLLIDERDYGRGHFRVGLESTGASDTFDVDMEGRLYRKWTFSGIPVDGVLTPVVSSGGNAKGGTIVLYMR